MSTEQQQLAKRGNSGMVQEIAFTERTELDMWAMLREQAGVLIKTGFLPQEIKTAEQALMVMLAGRELGIGPIAALQSINVIHGKPTLSAQLMLALCNRTGQVENLKIEGDEKGASCTIKRKGRESYTATFGPKEAQLMGLANKDNYRKQSAQMYRWRAISACVRMVFPEVVLGMYTVDEVTTPGWLDGGVIDNGADDLKSKTEVKMEQLKEKLTPKKLAAPPEQVKIEDVKPVIVEEKLVEKEPGWYEAIEVCIRDLRSHGVSMGEIQAKLEDAAGVKTRKQLNDQTGPEFLEICQGWLMDLDRLQAEQAAAAEQQKAPQQSFLDEPTDSTPHQTDELDLI